MASRKCDFWFGGLPILRYYTETKTSSLRKRERNTYESGASEPVASKSIKGLERNPYEG